MPPAADAAAGLPVFIPMQERVNLPGGMGSAVVNRLNSSAILRGAAIVCGVFAVCLMARAGELSNAAQREITLLLDRIEASNCSFARNGSWYPPGEARKHLQMKLDYMVKRNMLGSTEDFISKAATASSVSGEAYQIRCGAEAPIASATWLTAELKRIRSSS